MEEEKLLQQNVQNQDLNMFYNLCILYHLPNSILTTRFCPIYSFVDNFGNDLSKNIYYLIFDYICAINTGCAYVGQHLTPPPPPPKSDSVPLAVSYPTDINPIGVIATDFNSDGHIDLATANGESTVSILLNNGDGTFAPTVDYPTGISFPVSITFADFNGDNKVDLATITETANLFTILLGDGHGRFAQQIADPIYSGPNWVDAADFNGDGHIDLATASYSTSTVNIVFNKGDGTFALPINYTTYYNPNAMTVADFNGDGHIDLATASYSTSTVSILLNKGDGTLIPGISSSTRPPNHGSGYQPDYISTADFNGDGKIDIATANDDGTFSILLGYDYGIIAGGNLVDDVDYPANAMDVADFNGDGHIDLVAVVLTFQNTAVNILFGNGDGTFSTPYVRSYLTV